MPGKYDAHQPWEHASATACALHYAEHFYRQELWKRGPQGLARAMFEMFETLDDAGDAVVFSAWCGRMVQHHPELTVGDGVTFFDRLIEAVEGRERYAAYVAAHELPGVVVNTDAPSWRDFCAWLAYALDFERALQAD